MSSFFINTKKSSMKYFDNLPSIEKIWGKGNPDYDGTLSIVVVGASGNLAMLKTYPALFSLYSHSLLPLYTTIVGYARTSMTDSSFREKLRSALKGDKESIDAFLSICYYHSGQYNSEEDFGKLNERLNEMENTQCHLYVQDATGRYVCKKNRLFYFAIPPSQFTTVSKSIHETCIDNEGYKRIVVEKPFGRDYDSSKELNTYLQSLFPEESIYRIDHYLGKEMVQNLLITRFSNIIFNAVWSAQYIDNVQIVFKETIGVDGRGGYFDHYGIIRDVMQNHLLQIVSLISMEQPLSLHSYDIRDEKVRVLKSIEPLRLEDTIIGQYVGNGTQPGYLDDPTVPKDSLTATFAATILRINTPRWAGVPFYLKCGKALDEAKAEIRIQFKDIGCPLFSNTNRNELVLRVQPDTAIYLKTNIKSPGIETVPVLGELDMTYKKKYDFALPEAYERLILDIVRGDHSHFVRGDELEISWKIFTPLLHELEEKKVKPLPYYRGSRGPAEADVLRDKYGYRRSTDYEWVEP
ncbi:hypothetical protein WA171_004601, partial [Blastocystis sp. BT1]